MEQVVAVAIPVAVEVGMDGWVAVAVAVLVFSADGVLLEVLAGVLVADGV